MDYKQSHHEFYQSQVPFCLGAQLLAWQGWRLLSNMSVSAIFLCVSNSQHDVTDFLERPRQRHNPKFKEFPEYFPLSVAYDMCFNMIYKYIVYVKLSELEELPPVIKYRTD